MGNRGRDQRVFTIRLDLITELRARAAAAAVAPTVLAVPAIRAFLEAPTVPTRGPGTALGRLRIQMDDDLHRHIRVAGYELGVGRALVVEGALERLFGPAVEPPWDLGHRTVTGAGGSAR